MFRIFKKIDIMRQLPILFSTPMVQAILDNRKTMTRRTRGLEKVNENPDNWNLTTDSTDKGILFFNKNGHSDRMKPQYQIGDQIYIRETWMPNPNLEIFPDKPFLYKQNESEQFIEEWPGYWKPSIHMPKKAARIWLECNGVRCERLEDITDVDAISEGVESKIHKMFGNGYKSYILKDEPDLVIDFVKTAKDSFIGLWISINEESYNLNSNPWVFVYEFKRIEKP